MKKSHPKTPKKRRLSPRKSTKKTSKKKNEIEKEYVKVLTKVNKTIKEMKTFLEKNPSLKEEWRKFLETI
jgi:hypothetical protein